ncbi:MAG: type II toxin-antitoxin system HigB family toxin [Vulcanimicrobiaceae bacterium]
MRIISRRRLREYWGVHAGAEGPLRTWFAVAGKARWRNIVEVQQTYASAEAVGDYTVFNIKGNAYRLIVKIEYRLHIIFIRCVLTHAEYDKDNWK